MVQPCAAIGSASTCRTSSVAASASSGTGKTTGCISDLRMSPIPTSPCLGPQTVRVLPLTKKGAKYGSPWMWSQ